MYDVTNCPYTIPDISSWNTTTLIRCDKLCEDSFNVICSTWWGNFVRHTEEWESVSLTVPLTLCFTLPFSLKELSQGSCQGGNSLGWKLLWVGIVQGDVVQRLNLWGERKLFRRIAQGELSSQSREMHCWYMLPLQPGFLDFRNI